MSDAGVVHGLGTPKISMLAHIIPSLCAAKIGYGTSIFWVGIEVHEDESWSIRSGFEYEYGGAYYLVSQVCSFLVGATSCFSIEDDSIMRALTSKVHCKNHGPAIMVSFLETFCVGSEGGESATLSD